MQPSLPPSLLGSRAILVQGLPSLVSVIGGLHWHEQQLLDEDLLGSLASLCS